MEKIDLTKIQADINSRQLTASEQSPKRTEHQEKIIDKTWQTLVGIYGSTIVSAFGEEMPEEWILLLKGLTPNQIADGLTRLKDRKSPFHPNGVEFRQLCLPDTISPSGVNKIAYVDIHSPEHPRNDPTSPEYCPKPKGLEDLTKKEARRQVGRDTLDSLKDLF